MVIPLASILELFALEMESLTSEKKIKFKEQVVTLLHFSGIKCTALQDWMSENMRTQRIVIYRLWIKWKFPYFVSMTKINLTHSELSFEVKEISRIKWNDVHIAQKVKEVYNMTKLCAKRKKEITIILSYWRIRNGASCNSREIS